MLKRWLMLSMVVMLVSCQNQGTYSFIAPKTISGCYVRHGKIDALSRTIGDIYGSKAQIHEYLCIDNDHFIGGSYVTRLSDKYIEDAYLYYDEEYEKQLNEYIVDGGIEEEFAFDQKKLLKRVCEGDYTYIHQEVEKFVGTIKMKSGSYVYAGRTSLDNHLLESVSSRGQYRMKGSRLVIQETDSILGFYKTISASGAKEYEKVDFSTLKDKKIVIEGVVDDQVISKEEDASNYFSVKQHESLIDGIHYLMDEQHLEKLDASLKTSKKLQDISYNLSGLSEKQAQLTYLWQDKIYASHHIGSIYVEWMLDANQSIISVVQLNTKERCNYYFDDLSVVKSDEKTDDYYNIRCDDATFHYARNLKNDIEHYLLAHHCSMEELKDYVKKQY